MVSFRPFIFAAISMLLGSVAVAPMVHAAQPKTAKSSLPPAEMSQACRIAVRKHYEIDSRHIALNGGLKKQADGSYALNGSVNQGKAGKKKFSCRFDRNDNLIDLWALTPEKD